MTVLTDKNEELLKELLKIAGNPSILQQALSEVAAEAGVPIQVEALVRRILEIRHGASQAEPV